MKRLEESIRLHGVREPLVVYGSRDYPVLVDGHHRLSIAHALGHETVAVRWARDLAPVAGLGTTEEAHARAYAVRANRDRRQMNDFEVYEMDERVVAHEAARTKLAKARGEAIGREAERVAERLDISKDAVKRAKKVKEQGTPELQAEVRSGRKALKTAAAEIDDASDRRAKKEQAKQAPLPAAEDGKYGLIYMDFRDEQWFYDSVGPSALKDDVRAAVEFDNYSCTPAQVLEWFALGDTVLAIHVETEDLPYAGTALDVAFHHAATLPGAKHHHPVNVDLRKIPVQVLATGSEATRKENKPVHQQAHSYLLIARLTTNAPHRQTPVADVPLSIEDGDLYRALSAAWPGPAIRLLPRTPVGVHPDVEARSTDLMPAAWAYATNVDLEKRRDAAAAAAAATKGAKAPAPKKKGKAAADGPDPPETLVDEIHTDAATAYWAAACKASRSKKDDGECYLWADGKGRPPRPRWRHAVPRHGTAAHDRQRAPPARQGRPRIPARTPALLAV